MLKKIIITMICVCVWLPQVSLAIPGFMKERMGTISGKVMHAGKPLPKVVVSFFDVKKGLPPISGHKGRVPEQILLSDSEGNFSHKLLQGSYYLGALLRVTKPHFGPPRPGETFYFAQDEKGRLRKLAVHDYKKIDYGSIEFGLPESFKETEKSFRVEGTVLKGKSKKEPFAGALVLAKTSKSQFRRPEYISARTGQDGKFSLMLRPGPTFYLNARTTLTGQKPQPGDSVGRYSHEQGKDGKSSQQQGAGPPPGVGDDQSLRALNNEELPVTGDAGQVISGIKIYMYDMPETGPNAQKPIQKKIRRAAGIPRFTEGAAMKVFFANDSYQVKPKSFGELDDWVKFLKGDPGLLIELNGYSDNVGDTKYNLALSQKRAKAVAKYLIDKGVDSRRIRTHGYGSILSTTDNSTESRRQKNRRVEIKFIR